jgi:hypothetical protein
VIKGLSVEGETLLKGGGWLSVGGCLPVEVSVKVVLGVLVGRGSVGGWLSIGVLVGRGSVGGWLSIGWLSIGVLVEEMPVPGVSVGGWSAEVSVKVVLGVLVGRGSVGG